MEATGILAAGESTAALTYVKGRRGLSPRRATLIIFACMVAFGVPVAAWLSGSWLEAALMVECAFFGVVIGVFVVQRLTPPTMRKALAERGQSYEHQLTILLTPDALVYDLVDLTLTARWPCVTDLFQTRKHWVFLVQSSAMVLPRRFFATVEDERKFIAEAMSRMTVAAQARSRDAEAFVGAR